MKICFWCRAALTMIALSLASLLPSVSASADEGVVRYRVPAVRADDTAFENPQLVRLYATTDTALDVSPDGSCANCAFTMDFPLTADQLGQEVSQTRSQEVPPGDYLVALRAADQFNLYSKLSNALELRVPQVPTAPPGSPVLLELRVRIDLSFPGTVEVEGTPPP